MSVTSRACRARGLWRTTPTHEQTGRTVHCSRPPADQSGKRVASWTWKSPDTHDLLRRMSRKSYEENGPVEFKLKPTTNFTRLSAMHILYCEQNNTHILAILPLHVCYSVLRISDSLANCIVWLSIYFCDEFEWHFAMPFFAVINQT